MTIKVKMFDITMSSESLQNSINQFLTDNNIHDVQYEVYENLKLFCLWYNE